MGKSSESRHDKVLVFGLKERFRPCIFFTFGSLEITTSSQLSGCNVSSPEFFVGFQIVPNGGWSGVRLEDSKCTGRYA